MEEPLSKAKLSAFRKLQQKKHRELEGRFLIEGWHLLEAAMDADIPVRALVYEDSRKLNAGDHCVKEKAVRVAETAYAASESQLKALGETKTSPGVVAVVDRMLLDWEQLENRIVAKDVGFIVAMDGVSDPGNAGSIIRTCDWFGADAVLLGEGCPDLENGKTVRATMGALFHVPVASVGCLPETLGRLQAGGYQIVSSSLGDAVGLQGFAWPRKTVLVIGNEARGVGETILSLSDVRLTIPRFGKGESLNAALAASVLLGHWRFGG